MGQKLFLFTSWLEYRFSNCSEVSCFDIILFIFMQIFHLLKTSLFLVLSPALVRYSVVSLSYSLDFFPPLVRNVGQLVLQKNKFKSFTVMANTLYFFSSRLNYQPALRERSLCSSHKGRSVLFSLMIHVATIW